ncbi:MAG: DUF790 family protein, partial [Ardenticatenales bacterium]|nr:DUF790 family protein [Ardenticatenales bacterium]
MLPTPLLLHRYTGEELVPRRLPINRSTLGMATDAIVLFLTLQGKTQGEVDEALRTLEGEGTDYRIRRGLAHILEKQFSTFEVRSPIEPVDLRERLFSHAALDVPGPENSEAALRAVAQALTEERSEVITAEMLRAGLYADLAKNKVLTHFEEPTPEALLHRYNLAQVQGVFYRATEIVIHAYRNDPGEYKLLFRYLKLFQLLATIEGDVETGFTIRIDGPASLFS